MLSLLAMSRCVSAFIFKTQGSWISKIIGHLREFDLSYVLVMKTVNNIKEFEVIITHNSQVPVDLWSLDAALLWILDQSFLRSRLIFERRKEKYMIARNDNPICQKINPLYDSQYILNTIFLSHKSSSLGPFEYRYLDIPPVIFSA